MRVATPSLSAVLTRQPLPSVVGHDILKGVDWRSYAVLLDPNRGQSYVALSSTTHFLSTHCEKSAAGSYLDASSFSSSLHSIHPETEYWFRGLFRCARSHTSPYLLGLISTTWRCESGIRRPQEAYLARIEAFLAMLGRGSPRLFGEGMRLRSHAPSKLRATRSRSFGCGVRTARLGSRKPRSPTRSSSQTQLPSSANVSPSVLRCPKGWGMSYAKVEA